MAVAVTVVFGAVVVPHRTIAMVTTVTGTQLSDSIQQSLPQLYDTPLKRIMSYDTDPITQSVTATFDTDDSALWTLRNVVVPEDGTRPPLPSVGFVVRRPG